MNIQNNDDKILQLKEQIAKKKEQISKAQNFSPVTNCIIEFEGVNHNLRVLNNKDKIINLMVKLNVHAMSAKDLGVLDLYKISGYAITDWIKDLKSRLDYVGIKEEEAKLKAMEQRLDNLLSDGKKIELELLEFEKELN